MFVNINIKINLSKCIFLLYDETKSCDVSSTISINFKLKVVYVLIKIKLIVV